MAVRKIRLLGDPVLRMKCKPVREFSSTEVQRAIRDLRDTLEDFRSKHRFGRGIAAPQIGLLLNIIYIRSERLGPLINPKIIRRSKRVFKVWDDCFSFPDLLVQVRRNTTVEIVYHDLDGTRKSLKASHGLSELLQHEIDHINGILAIDRAINRQSIVLRSEIGR